MLKIDSCIILIPTHYKNINTIIQRLIVTTLVISFSKLFQKEQIKKSNFIIWHISCFQFYYYDIIVHKIFHIKMFRIIIEM